MAKTPRTMQPVMRWAAMCAAGAVCGMALAAACPRHQPGVPVATIASPQLIEVSGLAASRKNADVLWAHNDSGDSARVFALNTSGAHLGVYNLSGASAIDWEDMAIGPGPTPGVHYLFLADIGDNFNIRSTIRVYRVPEPIVNAQQAPVTVNVTGVETITLRYPDGARDAETLMVDVNGDIYIVTKRVSAVGRVYRAAFPQSTSSTITLEFVAQLPWGAVNGNGGATGGDISAGGTAIIVRRLSGFVPAATLWRRAPGTNLWDAFSQTGCDYALAAEPQGEAICFASLGLGFYTTSEGANQPLNFYQRIPTPGDANGDDVVNVADLLAVINAWGPCPPPPAMCPADVAPPGGDGAVNVSDLLKVINSWG